MNILTCSDQENLGFVKTMLASLFDSNRVPMDIFLCYSGADCGMLTDLERLVTGTEGKTITVIKTDDIAWTNAFTLLPSEVKKVLFLDEHDIVKGDISTFYDTDVTGYYMAVCDDIFGRLNGSITDEVAFDEGVILINTELIVSEDDKALERLSEDKLLWMDWSLYDCPPAYYYLDLEAAKAGKLSFADYETIKRESADAESFTARYSNITKQIADSAKIIHYRDGSSPHNPDREEAAVFDIFDKYFKAWDENMLLRPERVADGEILRRIKDGEFLCESQGVYLDDFLRVTEDIVKENRAAGAKQENEETNGERIWRAMTEDLHGGKALFLPYKASMWDSLESVWEAAVKDDKWDVTVSVIPYYDKVDGQLRPENMHCETAEFPKNVPIKDHKTLQLEKEHYDIIFIHNPYDQYNFVTSIAPEYYAPELKKHTGRLVYIPYFVHNNEGVAFPSAVNPGTTWSDYTIIATEKVRAQYIAHFTKGVPDYEKYKGVGSIEKKFIALGSPKYDVKSDLDNIPDEWRCAAYDGEVKKTTIFLNIHLDSIMGDNAVPFFGKMRRIMDFFEKRKDIAVLWRPHPLMVQTAKSINPAAVEPYLAIVEDFKRRGIGIFDETSDFHRAVEFCDLCYGDGGSTSEFFRQMKKPMLYYCREM